MSEEEERVFGLLVRDKNDKRAGQKLVVHNLRLAIKMAHQYKRAWANLMDLLQEASTGLAIAAQKWDPDQGTRFGTYAAYWIRAQLTKFLMTHGRLIHTGNTRAGRKLFHQLPRIRRKLVAAGELPNVANIAKESGESEEEVARIVSRLDAREASLSAPIGGPDGDSTLGDLVAADGSENPEVLAAKQEVSNMMDSLILSFSKTIENERDKAIWQEHLLSQEPTSLVALGKRYGVSKQRMGQLATHLSVKLSEDPCPQKSYCSAPFVSLLDAHHSHHNRAPRPAQRAAAVVRVSACVKWPVMPKTMPVPSPNAKMIAPKAANKIIRHL